MTNKLIKKRILVTGGAGAIGSNLVEELSKYDCEIIVLDDLSSGHKDLLVNKPNVMFIEGSILDDALLRKIFAEKINIVFHLAALFANQNSVEHPDIDLLVNGMGTLKLLEYARNAEVDRFVFTSSSCVYGDLSAPAHEEKTQLNPDTPYAITKLLGERYVNYFHKHFGLKTAIIRIFNSFGPGEKPGIYRNVIPNFFAKAIKGEPLPIFGDGSETRDFNWVENLIQAMILCVEKDEAVGHTFNIGSGKETQIIDIAKIINKISGNKSEITYLSRRSWDKVLNRSADISKAKLLLGYTPNIEDYEVKLTMTYEWIKKLK